MVLIEHINYLLSCFKNIKSKCIINHFLSLFVGNCSGQLIIILSSPLLSRLYSPADFGLLELIISIFSIISVVTNLKLENAIVTQKTNVEANYVFSLCFYVNLLIFLLGMLILGVCNFFEYSLFKKILGDWWWAPPLLGWFSGMQQAIQMYFIRQKKYNIISIFLFLQGLGLVSLQLLYGHLMAYTAPALVLGYIINNGIICFMLFLFFLKSENFEIKIQLRRFFFKISECKNFIFYTVPTSLLGAVSQRSFFLILGAFFTDSDVGFAGLAIRVIYTPLSLITRSMGQVFFGLFSEKKDDVEFVNTITQLIQWKIISISLCIPIVLNAPTLFEFCFGSQWKEAGYYAMLISPAAFMLFLTAWLDRTYDVVSLQKRGLSLELAYNATLVSGLLTVSYCFDSPLYLVGFYGVFTAIYNIVWLVLTMKVIGISYKNAFKNILFLIICISLSFLLYVFINLYINIYSTILLYYLFMSMLLILLTYTLRYKNLIKI